MTKVKVKALKTFSHGNIDALKDSVYDFNKGDAAELEKAGFVSLQSDGESEGVQNDEIHQVAQPGDVVVDNGPDMLGAKEKMQDGMSNKMADAPVNKTRSKKAE